MPETFSFSRWHTSRHTNSCVQFPAVDDNIFPATALTSPSLSTIIFSHIFNLLSAFTYNSTSSYAVLMSPSTMPSSHCSSTISLWTHSPLLPWFHFSSTPPLYPILIPPPRPGPLTSHSSLPHAARNQLGALGRLESACAYTKTALVACCSHHRRSETWSDIEQTWAQQIIHRQSTTATGALAEQTVPPNSKSPLVRKFSMWLWVLFGFVWLWVCFFFFNWRSRPEDYPIIQPENLSNIAVRFHPVTAILSFFHMEPQICVGLKSNL